MQKIKIFGVLAEFQPPVELQLWIGGIIELPGVLAITLDFQSRLLLLSAAA